MIVFPYSHTFFENIDHPNFIFYIHYLFCQVITVAAEILSELPVGKFLIKLNHRKLLDAIFEICGVPAEKFRPICSAVDKLDKAPWDEVIFVVIVVLFDCGDLKFKKI